MKTEMIGGPEDGVIVETDSDVFEWMIREDISYQVHDFPLTFQATKTKIDRYRRISPSKMVYDGVFEE